MWCFIDLSVVMLDGPPIAVGHPLHSCGTTNLLWPWTEASQDFTASSLLSAGTPSRNRLGVLLIRYCWTEPTRMTPSAYAYNDTHKRVSGRVPLDKCLSRIRNVGGRIIKNSNAPSEHPAHRLIQSVSRFSGQHRSTFPLFTLVGRMLGCALLPKTLLIHRR